MISLIMPPKDQVSRVQKMLLEEFGTASNIKNRVNRQSVLGAITSAQQRLKLYNRYSPRLPRRSFLGCFDVEVAVSVCAKSYTRCAAL